jgi:hypothetical protein
MKQRDEGVKWFNTTFYPKERTGRAMRYEDGILPRVSENTITLFTPWGPRYSWKERGIDIVDTDKEVLVLRRLREVLDMFICNMLGKTFTWVFLGADLYGTRVNNLSEEIVSGYFSNVEKRVLDLFPEATFSLWSDFDRDAEAYRDRVRNDFSRYVDGNLLTRAENTARGLGCGGDARAYLVERFAEAMYIEDRFRPVKLSCVGRHKDAKVDHQLPVLYVVPEALHAPWV